MRGTKFHVGLPVDGHGNQIPLSQIMKRFELEKIRVHIL